MYSPAELTHFFQAYTRPMSFVHEAGHAAVEMHHARAGYPSSPFGFLFSEYMFAVEVRRSPGSSPVRGAHKALTLVAGTAGVLANFPDQVDVAFFSASAGDFRQFEEAGFGGKSEFIAAAAMLVPWLQRSSDFNRLARALSLVTPDMLNQHRFIGLSHPVFASSVSNRQLEGAQ